ATGVAVGAMTVQVHGNGSGRTVAIGRGPRTRGSTSAAKSGRGVRGAGLAVLAGLALAGCGVGAGEAPEDVGLRVSDRFGTAAVLDRTPADVAGEDTVVRLLQRNAKVETSSGGTFVASIEGRAGGVDDAYWVFFRNGAYSDE